MLISALVFVGQVFCPLIFISFLVLGGECGDCIACRKIFWDPARCGHWVFQVGLSVCLDPRLKNEEGLWGWREHLKREEARCSPRVCLVSPLGMGAEGEKKLHLQVCQRAKSGIGIEGMEGEVKICS